MPELNPIDLNLVDKMHDCIPEWTWHVVKQTLVNALVDEMPTSVLEKLTNDPEGDDRAVEILDDYYRPTERNKDLLVDSFRIIGKEQTAYILDLLQLNKITQPKPNV